MSERTFPLPPDALVELRLQVGDVDIRPSGPDGLARLELRGDDEWIPDVAFEDGDGRVRIDIGGSRPRHHSEVEVVLYLPAKPRAIVRTSFGSLDARDLVEADLDLGSDAGRVIVEDVNGKVLVVSDLGKVILANVEGQVEVRGRAGSVRLDQVRGDLRLTNDAGSIKGVRLAGRFDVKTHAGSVRLAIDALDEGEHRITADVGSVRIDLAPDIDVRIDARASGFGSARSSYPSKADAPRSLVVATHVGSVRIRLSGDSARDDGRMWGEDWFRSRFKGSQGWAGPFSTAPPPPAPPASPEPLFAASAPPEETSRSGQDRYSSSSARPGVAVRRRVDPGELQQILDLVAAGKLAPGDASDLIRALES